MNSFQQTFIVNVEGTVFFTEGFIPLIQDQGILLNISSKMGLIAVCELTYAVAYRMSKSALNMYTKILSNRLNAKLRVAAIHPGWVKKTLASSNMTNGRLTPPILQQKTFTALSTAILNMELFGMQKINRTWLGENKTYL